MRLLLAMLGVGVVAALGMAVTTTVALAYPPPSGHHELKCEPGDVDAHFGSCSLTFKDQDKDAKPVFGQNVCFHVTNGPGSVSPSCSSTDSKGVARSTYFAGDATSSCSSKDPKATVLGFEDGASPSGDELGAAQTQIKIKCPEGGGGGGGGGGCTSHCKGDNLTSCTSFCTGNNNTACQHDCSGNNNTVCTTNCTGNNNPQCTSNCSGDNNPKCTSNCSGGGDADHAQPASKPATERGSQPPVPTIGWVGIAAAVVLLTAVMVFRQTAVRRLRNLRRKRSGTG